MLLSWISLGSLRSLERYSEQPQQFAATARLVRHLLHFTIISLGGLVPSSPRRLPCLLRLYCRRQSARLLQSVQPVGRFRGSWYSYKLWGSLPFCLPTLYYLCDSFILSKTSNTFNNPHTTAAAAPLQQQQQQLPQLEQSVTTTTTTTTIFTTTLQQ